MSTPSSITPITSDFTRTVTGASESINSSIDAMQMPFEDELTKYAVVTDDAINDVVTGVKATLSTLKDLTTAMRILVLNPTDHNNTYTATTLDELASVLNGVFSNASEIAGEVKYYPRLQLDPTPVDDAHAIATVLETNPGEYTEEYTQTKTTLETKPSDHGAIYTRTLTLQTTPTDHDDEFTPTITITLDPSLFTSEYTHVLDTLIQTYASTAGTGLNASVEAAIYARARARILQEAGRISRRIVTDTAKRLPYAGMLADLLMEADEDTVNAMADVNNKILEEQGRLAYQSQIDRINQAIAFEKDLMSNFHQTKDRLMRAYIAYDDIQIKKDSNDIQNFQQTKERILKAFIGYDDLQLKKDSYDINIHENSKQRLLKAYLAYDELGFKLDEIGLSILDTDTNRKMKAYIAYDDLQMKLDSLGIENTEKSLDRKLRAYIAYDDLQLKQFSASIDLASLVYQNRRDAINSAINIEQLSSQNFHSTKDRHLKAASTYEELELRNHWSYYETMIKQYLSYLQLSIDFLKSAVYNPDQLTFNNWLEMSKLVADGQLKIAAMVSNLMPSGQTLA